VRKVVVYRRTGGKIAWNADRDVWLHELMANQPASCEPEWVGADTAVRSVHVRFDRQTERRPALDRAAICCGRC